MDEVIGIIGAMDSEVDHLKGLVEGAQVTERAGMSFVRGTLNGQPVVVVRSGVGKVNAAVCAQVLCGEFAASKVVFTGVAGSLDEHVGVGDLVISTACLQHDMDVTPLGYALGEVPGTGLRFEADPELAGAVRDAASEVAPQAGVFEGLVVSGDAFVGSADAKERISRNFADALCCEMEGAAVAQACVLNGVPFVVVRAISDNADGSADMTYASFEKMAAERSACIVARMLAALG